MGIFGFRTELELRRRDAPLFQRYQARAVQGCNTFVSRPGVIWVSLLSRNLKLSGELHPQ